MFLFYGLSKNKRPISIIRWVEKGGHNNSNMSKPSRIKRVKDAFSES
jgi:hypothetical protein